MSDRQQPHAIDSRALTGIDGLDFLLDGGLPAGPRQDDAFAIRLEGRRILVVDDDAATRELLTRVLERTGASVESAESAPLALARLTRNKPDLLIADIGMPDEDGYSLMRRIRALPGAVGAIPAIALSAYTRAEARGSAEDAGFTRFIPKPATPQDLLRAIDALLNPVQQPSRPAVDDH